MKVEWGGVVLLNLTNLFLERAGPIAPPFWAPRSSINFQPPVGSVWIEGNGQVFHSGGLVDGGYSVDLRVLCSEFVVEIRKH